MFKTIKCLHLFNLDDENVLYRCLVVFKALVDCADKLNSYELEYLRIHVCDTINDETAKGLGKG